MPDNRYDDIIRLPHPTSKKHPRMTRLNRAAQFAPFAALTGYDNAIAEASRLTDDRIELNEADQLALGEKLAYLKPRLSDNPLVALTYFRADQQKSGGEYISLTSRISKIREYERELVLETGEVITFENLLEIDYEL